MKIKKLDLESRIEEDTLDLSLMRLEGIDSRTFQQIGKMRKVSHLDLSNNKLTELPSSIELILNITELDLSQNRLKHLPESFGNLVQLKKLDLWKNQLQTLPQSFCKLINLKWMDLKDNPLIPAIKERAGDCDNQKQCEACAYRIVQYFQQIHEAKEIQKHAKEQKELKEIENLHKTESKKEKKLNKTLNKNVTSEPLVLSKVKTQPLLPNQKINTKRCENKECTRNKSWLATFMSIFAILLLTLILLICNSKLIVAVKTYIAENDYIFEKLKNLMFWFSYDQLMDYLKAIWIQFPETINFAAGYIIQFVEQLLQLCLPVWLIGLQYVSQVSAYVYLLLKEYLK